MNFLPREDYHHPGPLGPALDLTKVSSVTLHHTVTSATTAPETDVLRVAEIGVQRFGQSSYNYTIQPMFLGRVYEMQGLHRGAHNGGHNSTTLGLSIIGDFTNRYVSIGLKEAIADFVVTAFNNGWVQFPIIKGHRDFKATSCPGNQLAAAMPSIQNLIKEKTVAVNDEPATWAAWAWEKANALGARMTDPDAVVTDQRLAVLLDRMGLLDPAAPATSVPEHTHDLPNHTHKPGGVA